ncbi:tRNA lysidine(34) synthetase TilS [Prevotella melaninogenica]|uniref:tRNA lysidine(34) synthetase TilS n=1 Tax=Prevotella melaninogenica TaxID=28132 RepID=UPI001BA6C7AE|nr:tRNA lysidine(34) synthetase TilS [Prevotella melaninogenica]QUB66480.1 tRNA lysidine(34) synthetase TilS [Prevotella melaninogenica]
MLNKIKRFIASEHLLQVDALYLVALSGGADSVALLLCLKELGYRVEAVHCNFNLRGEESLRDEQFCEDLCQRENIPLHKVHFDTQAYADLHKVSIEMAARELRYRYFFQLKEALGADGVCVGHHKEDSIETILINLVRGTGLSGLMGIRPRNHDVIRPLLCVTRQEIEDYLHQHAVSFVTDSTNLIDDVVRNKIRLNVLPQLSEINPSVTDAILTTANHLSEVDAIVQESLKEALEKAVSFINSATQVNSNSLSNEPFQLNLSVVRAFPSPSYLLFYILKPLGFSSSQIAEMVSHLDGQTGQLWYSSTHEVTHDRGVFMVLPRVETEPRQLVIPEIGRYVYDEQLSLRLTERALTPSSRVSFSKNPTIVDLDASSIRFPLTLRRVAEGDRFTPLGMRGTQLMSDFLTNLKRNRFEKRNQLVLLDATGTILWVLGLRINDHFKLTPQSTSCLRIEIL